MSLTKPPDWPPSLPAPLFAVQADEVRQYRAATHEEVAVVVHCRKCRHPVGDVVDLTFVDEAEQGFYLPILSVYRGTIRSSNGRLDVAKNGRQAGHAGELPEKRPGQRVPLDDQYLACLETQSANLLPALLPGWCDREGHLAVERRAVSLAVATWRREAHPRPARVDARPFPPRRAS